MPRDFPEPDWKTLSRLKPLALDRLCQRILQESGGIVARAREGEHHRVYLDLYRHIHESDETVAVCFNDFKRSQAINILANWRMNDLLTEEEFASFSPETCEVVNFLLRRARRE
ncbi:MAG: peptide ABC transporter substrate-binding protein [Chloroflexota bacterium]